MPSSSIIQVILLLCAILSFPSTTAVRGRCFFGFDRRALVVLKDVDIRKDGEITSLGKTFGADPRIWSCDSHVVVDMTFTALCCWYSSKIIRFVQTVENDLAECEGSPDKRSFVNCCGVRKLKSEPLLVMAGNMLTTALNFTRMFYTAGDKNVLNAIMSFYLFVKYINDSRFYYYCDNIVEKFVEMKLYTRYLIEAFAVLNCSRSVYDVDHQLNRVNRIDGFDYEIPYVLNLPETYFKLENLHQRKLVLPKVLEIRLDSGNFEQWSSLGYRLVSFHYREIRVLGFMKLYEDDFRSEILTQNQTIVFQCIVSVVLHLINLIIVTSENEKENVYTKRVVNKAINVLNNFDFQGVLYVQLRQVLYHRMMSSNSRKPFRNLNEGSQIIDSTITENIHLDKLESVNALTEMLEQLSNDLLVMEPEIDTVLQINQILCDYQYEEVGFLQDDSSTVKVRHSSKDHFDSIEKAIPILERLKEKNCQFSHIAVVHFVLIDYIITQCDAILSDFNNLDMALLLETCFDSMAKSIRSIEETIDQSLVAIIDILKSTRPHNNANRKVIDSILAMKLYMGNDSLLNSKVPLTDHGYVDVSQVASKLDTLKRYNRFVTNLIEQYTVHSCSTRSPRETSTKDTLNKIHQQCNSVTDENDKANIIECVDVIIADNLKLANYDPGESQTNINDYTIGNLLMDKVLEKASNNDNGLSMLHELDFPWEGGYNSLPEIVDFVKNNINPKYLCKYQLIVIKAIVLVVYKKIETIIRSSTSSNDNFQLYRSSMNTILENLKVISRDFLPLAIFRIYELIVDHFDEYFQGNASVNDAELIRIIEKEQFFMGNQKKSSDTFVETSSKSKDVETATLYALKMDAKTNIDQLVSYLAVVEDIRPNLKNVALLLDLKRISTLQI